MQGKTSMETPDTSPTGTPSDMGEDEVRPNSAENAATGVPLPNVQDVPLDEQAEED